MPLKLQKHNDDRRLFSAKMAQRQLDKMMCPDRQSAYMTRHETHCGSGSSTTRVCQIVEDQVWVNLLLLDTSPLFQYMTIPT